MNTSRIKNSLILTQAGLNYSSRDWIVFPVDKNKRPVCKWQEEATTNPDAIQRLFSRPSATGIAIATGPRSKILVLDLDRKNGVDGIKTCQGLEDELGTLPQTLQQKTGSGGLHLFFQYPQDVVIRNSAGKLGSGIDVRGQGGYVVAPPSLNQAGAYEWLNDFEPAPLPPAWMNLLIDKSKSKTLSSILSSTTSRYGQKALLKESLAVANTPEGQRNNALNISALKIGQLVAGGEIASSDAIKTLMDAAIMCGLPEREAFTTISSGLNKGMTEPRKGFQTRTRDWKMRQEHELTSLHLSYEQKQWQPTTKPWPILSEDALPGIIGKFVHLATKDSEADPAAVLATFLIRMGVAVGGPTIDQRPYLYIGDTRHEPRIFGVICGQSSKARKGTSAGPVTRLFTLTEHSAPVPPKGVGSTSQGPLSSGEGIVYAVRDEMQQWDEKRQTHVVIDPGVEDKRLFVLEEEFAAALNAGKRDGNTLSATLRTLYDSGNRSPLTKTSRISCTGAHVGICAHITLDELHITLPNHDILNGYANRFLWVLAKRQRLVPIPKRIPDQDFSEIQLEFFRSITMAHDIGLMSFTDCAASYWTDIYDDLSQDTPGIIGSVTARAEAQVVRLAMIYAICDQSKLININHIKAAQAFWNYCNASARYIFGDISQNKLDRFIHETLISSDIPLSLTDIHAATGRNQKGDHIKAALQLLCDRGVITSTKIIDPHSKRPRTVYALIKCLEGQN